jgi:hypothetical protein
MPGENVAIILAVSEYATGNHLPGCKNDGQLIRSIIQEAGGKFSPERTLFIENETTSAKVKGELSKFIAGLSGIQVDELFFYYTGHGLFDGSEFYYQMSDYLPSKPQGTTLTNTELDNMFRSLKPELAVKVVDACYSGQQYVKSAEEFEKLIKGTTQTGYNRCYFMFSSQSNQTSLISGSLSDFTLQFAKAIEAHSSNTIRYKDIIDHVSDAFLTNARQKPFFVVQANYTEIFCDIADDLRYIILGQLPQPSPPGPGKNEQPAPEKPSLLDALRESVRKNAALYCTQEEATKTFAAVKTAIESYQLVDPLSDFYRLKKEFKVDSYDVPNPAAIGDWLKNNMANYFVELNYALEPYVAEEAIRKRGALGGFDLFPEYREVTKHRTVIAGFDSTEKIPYKSVHILAEPTLQNVPWWMWYLAFVVSKTTLRCFLAHEQLREINWKERKGDGKCQWRIREIPLKDAEGAKTQIVEVLNQFAEPMTQYLIEMCGLSTTEEKKEETAST